MTSEGARQRLERTRTPKTVDGLFIFSSSSQCSAQGVRHFSPLPLPCSIIHCCRRRRRGGEKKVFHTLTQGNRRLFLFDSQFLSRFSCCLIDDGNQLKIGSNWTCKAAKNRQLAKTMTSEGDWGRWRIMMVMPKRQKLNIRQLKLPLNPLPMLFCFSKVRLPGCDNLVSCCVQIFLVGGGGARATFQKTENMSKKDKK